jgi:hypothetical protein
MRAERVTILLLKSFKEGIDSLKSSFVFLQF